MAEWVVVVIANTFQFQVLQPTVVVLKIKVSNSHSIELNRPQRVGNMGPPVGNMGPPILKEIKDSDTKCLRQIVLLGD